MQLRRFCDLMCIATRIRIGSRGGSLYLFFLFRVDPSVGRSSFCIFFRAVSGAFRQSFIAAGDRGRRRSYCVARTGFDVSCEASCTPEAHDRTRYVVLLLLWSRQETVFFCQVATSVELAPVRHNDGDALCFRLCCFRRVLLCKENAFYHHGAIGCTPRRVHTAALCVHLLCVRCKSRPGAVAMVSRPEERSCSEDVLVVDGRVPSTADALLIVGVLSIFNITTTTCIFSNIKKIHFSCEIDQKYFDQNSALQAARDTSIARVTGCVYPREGYRSVTPLLMPGSTGLRHSSLFCA